jgi:membrane protein YqaA with SNARE-associated domain
MLHSLYDWTIHFASTPNAVWALAVISFVEASVFPIPPDILLIPMVIAAPDQAWWLATVATLASVAGGFVGYGIGYFAFETLGKRVLRVYGLLDKYLGLERLYRRWGVWIIVIKGMTPIPYKIVTIASGAFHFNLVKFGLASVVCRSIRFFLLAALLFQFGESIRSFIESQLTLVSIVFVIALVGGFVVLRYLIPRKSDKGAT